MELHARAPDPLSGTGNMATNWRTWIEDFTIFMHLTGYDKKPDAVKVNLLKNRIGRVGLEAINMIQFTNPSDKDKMDKLIENLGAYFDPPKNETMERYSFFTRARKPNERIEEYILQLKIKAETCNFGNLKESLIRDKIILGTHDVPLRNKYFEEKDLTLSKLVEICKHHEATNMMKGQSQTNTASGSTPSVPKGKCSKCGHKHEFKKCPAYGKKCEKCNEMNHFPTHCPKFRTVHNNNLKCTNNVDKNTKHKNVQGSKAQKMGMTFNETSTNMSNLSLDQLNERLKRLNMDRPSSSS